MQFCFYEEDKLTLKVFKPRKCSKLEKFVQPEILNPQEFSDPQKNFNPKKFQEYTSGWNFGAQ